MEKTIILNNQETHYSIDTIGRLKNTETQKYLKGAINKGYHFYNIYFKGKQYTLYTHKLVAEYFIPNPNNLPIVHHLDGNKLNNIVSNLQWLSEKEHQQTMNFNVSHTKQVKISEEDYEIAQFRGSPYYATTSGHVINIEKHILMKEEQSGKYKRVQCNYNLNGKHFLVHRIVWEAFNGPIKEGYDIDHIDGNPENNALSNLQELSHIENCRRANHNQRKVKAVDKDTNEVRHFNSRREAERWIGGQIYYAIEHRTIYKNNYWFYEE